MGEINREGDTNTVGYDPEGTTIAPIGTARFDCADQPLDVIGKKDVIMLGVSDVMGAGLGSAVLRSASERTFTAASAASAQV